MPTRLTATIPPMRGAGEVAPLPRQRAPQGTQRGVPAINPRVPGGSVRMSTAPSLLPLPTIPASSRPPVDVAPRSEGSIADRTTRPSLPSPRPSSLPIPQVADGTGQSQAIPPAPRTTSRPSLPPPTRTSAPRVTGGMRTVAPSTMPVVAPFESTPPHAMPAQSAGFVAPGAPLAYPSAAPYLPHLPNDMTSNQAWFDQQSLDTGGVAVDVEIEISGTARVTKTTDWKSLIPRLIAPTAGLVILGVFVGGFFAFNGEGGRSNTASAGVLPAKAIVPESKDQTAEPEPVSAGEVTHE